MELVLTEDQTMLAATAKEFVESTAPLTRLRKLREDASGPRYSPDVWARVALLGWTALPFAEADGGLGLGLAEAAIVAEGLGRQLAPEPFVECVVLAGRALARAGSSAQKAAHLAPLVAGTSRFALAHQETGARGAHVRVETRAERSGGAYRLSGEKAPVLGGVGAAAFLVPARTEGDATDEAGITLFLVPADAKGLRVTPLRRVDARNAARLTLGGVEVPATEVVGDVGGGHAALSAAVDDATVALSAEMLGGMTSAFERTIRYLKEREQFGAKIGTFQALQHRAARLFVEIELTRSAVMAAARAVDEGAESARALVSVAKARASDAFVLVANEAIQMHGGIGMTNEHDIGFFLKRAKAAELTFGDAAFHRARFAALRGF